MKDMGKILKELRVKKGMTQEEVGKVIGVGKAAIQKYEKGSVQNMRRSSIEKLSALFGVTPTYLMGLQELPLHFAPGAVRTADIIPIPIINKIAAGSGCLTEEKIDGYEYIPADEINNPQEYVFLKIQGDCMYPIFIENDLALIKKQSSVDSGSYAVVTIDNEDGVIKKVVYGPDWLELHSVNPMYPVRRFEGNEILNINIIGLVKKSVRKF